MTTSFITEVKNQKARQPIENEQFERVKVEHKILMEVVSKFNETVFKVAIFYVCIVQ